MVILGTMIHGTMTTSSKKDYLSILGLSPDFDDKELKKAFRREARKWHPDLNKNDLNACLLYTSPSPRDGLLSRMPSSA